MSSVYVWIGLAIFFLFLEVLTPGNLISIWFFAGAILASLGALFGFNLFIQAFAFLIGSALLIILTRKHLRPSKPGVEENLGRHALLGRRSIVLEEVDNLKKTGCLRENGCDWTCRSEDGERIPEGTTVEILKIEGNTLIVIPVEKLKYTV